MKKMFGKLFLEKNLYRSKIYKSHYEVDITEVMKLHIICHEKAPRLKADTLLNPNSQVPAIYALYKTHKSVMRPTISNVKVQQLKYQNIW